MVRSTLALAALALVAGHARASPWSRRATLTTDLGYVSPLENGGSMLTEVDGTWPEGLREPVNIIMSANSDPEVLVDAAAGGGLRNYWLSLQMGAECLGQSLGNRQRLNLGDGNGTKNQTAVIRFNYGDPYLGTCRESIIGGNHFRYWTQNGASANTSAVFMAASSEKSAAEFHDIIKDGYNLGRDWIVGNATAHPGVPTGNLTAGDQFIGSTVVNGYTYQTTAVYVAGLLANSSDTINHADSVEKNGRPAVDGLVAVLTVRITAWPSGQEPASHQEQKPDAALPRTWSLSLASLVGAAALALWC